jgi:hypothetical protein
VAGGGNFGLVGVSRVTGMEPDKGKAMTEVMFDLKDPRNIVYKYGMFEVLIMFAWDEGSEIPAAARLNVTRHEPFAYAQMDQVYGEWSSLEVAVDRLKNYAKLLADDMPIRS